MGRFAESVRIWQQAVQQETDPLQKSIGLSNLSLGLQQLGKWKDAEVSIERSLKLIKSIPPSKDQLQTLAQVLNTQGSLKFALGRSEDARFG